MKSIGICYPGPIKSGMAGTGIRILHSYFSGRFKQNVFFSGTLGERDAGPIPLFRGNDHDPKEYDYLVFSVVSEDLYPNMVKLLRDRDIPLRCEDRGPDDPIVIGGGKPVMANILPIKDIFDAIGIGELESLIPPFCDIAETQPVDRELIREELAAVDGFYVPAFDNQAERVASDEIHVPKPYLFSGNPELEKTLDIEVTRGCRHSCTFCQAQVLDHPYRERSADEFEEYLDYLLEHKEDPEYVKLIGLSAMEHSQIKELLEIVYDRGLKSRFSSNRIDRLHEMTDIHQYLAKQQRFGVEVAGEEARGQLGKYFGNKQVFELIEQLNRVQDISKVTLMFIIGMTDDREEEDRRVRRIIKLINEAYDICDHKLDINISIFIPETFTYLEDMTMADMDYIRQKWDEIMAEIPNEVGRINPDDTIDHFFLCGIYSRGGEELLDALERAYELDLGWRHGFEHWEQVFESCGIDWEEIVYSSDQKPWRDTDNWNIPNAVPPVGAE